VRLGLLIAVRTSTAVVVSAAAVQFWGLAVRGETPRLTPSLALPPTGTAVAAVGAGGAKHVSRARQAPHPAAAPPAVATPSPLVIPSHHPRGKKPRQSPAVRPAPRAAKPRSHPHPSPSPSPSPSPAPQPQVGGPPVVPQIAPAPPAAPTADEQEPDPHSHVAIARSDPGLSSSAGADDQSRRKDATHGKRSRP
jgi:hypothetical protein